MLRTVAYLDLYKHFFKYGFTFLSPTIFDVTSIKNKFIYYFDKKTTFKKYSIIYKTTNFIKSVSYKNIDKNLFQYIRKNKIFNKGRYSRNRQLYRTGVY